MSKCRDHPKYKPKFGSKLEGQDDFEAKIVMAAEAEELKRHERLQSQRDKNSGGWWLRPSSTSCPSKLSATNAGESDARVVVDQYSLVSRKKLREILRKRDLATSGEKDDLLTRLKANDTLREDNDKAKGRNTIKKKANKTNTKGPPQGAKGTLLSAAGAKGVAAVAIVKKLCEDCQRKAPTYINQGIPAASARAGWCDECAKRHPGAVRLQMQPSSGDLDTLTGGSGAGGKWLKADFVAECKRRGLPTKGTVAELHASLEGAGSGTQSNAIGKRRTK